VSRETGLATLLTRPADPGRTVALGPGGAVSLERLRADVADAAAAFAGEPGANVVLHEADCYRFAVALLACWHGGRTAILAADRLPATGSRLAQELGAALGELPAARAPAAHERALPLTAIDRERVLLRVYTSGSTGAPQLIDKTLAQLESEVGAIEAALGADVPAGAAVAGTVSHQHFYGLMFRVLWPLACGRALVGRVVRFPEELALLPSDRPSVLVTSPVFLRYVERASLPGGLRLCLLLCAGSPLASAVGRAACSATGAPLREIYGSSETGAVAMRRGPGADWEPLPGVELRVGADGVLEVRAAQLPAHGWQRTADRARAAGGSFELLGRADRLAKIGDKRVSLDRLEAALAASPLVGEARVVVIAGPRTQLGAVVVPSGSGAAQLAEHGAFALGRALRRELAHEFEAVVLPRRFRFVAALPSDALGKTRSADLLALFAAAHRWPVVRSREISANRQVLQLEMAPGLDCFDGHFPGQPIVPGAAQLDWAIAFGRAAFGITADFVGVDALKFHRVIAPGAAPRLVLEWRAPQTLAFRIESDVLHASGRVIFAGTRA